ncbi:phosphonate ABC transporter substrate-binding protein [Phyllobacterium brassicacearum]|uniref:Phosphonate ABC transporter substrate-binding protein n=1 Tax=Phyllobacterium brassicacearum TaxID=314235 RepID=A0A2P7BRH6_9HYPH|nr:substrate-binding domain-containing protein [Phyllobacterium brassicacearum]PSH69076.1 phosphonate ABC transporter substrate-binding protein [Phyllobacterium brassicacearum]TDQ25326.1 phosphate ABC transporter substrate-binding protein (PhoT family) [Phyllobacterium brassicacearum]
MNKLFSTAALLAIAVAASTVGASARDQIQVSGSSTVLPYAKIVAESFGETFPDFKTPVVESGGSGAGIKEFCKGVGEETIDIANSSRPIKDTELKSCVDAGVKDVQEVRIGYDGIVFATDIKGPDWKLTPKDVYLALAAQVIVDGKLVNNPNTKWNQVNPAFPDWDIAAYIPGEKHGTREVFEERLLSAGCKASGATDTIKTLGLDEKAAAAACVKVRKDGKAIDIDGDYAETLARIDANKTGVGVFGLAFYENNADKLKVATVSDVVPSTETISSGKYPVSRPLFFYVKKAHLGVIPGLKEYVEFFLNDQMIGEDSPLVEYGLVAAPEAERKAQRDAFAAGTTMKLK